MERAQEIVRLSLYADPMMDEVIVVKNILNKLDSESSLLLLCLSLNMPKELLKSIYSENIEAKIRTASDKFLGELKKVYG